MRTLKAVAALDAGKATECPLCGRIYRKGLRDCPYCSNGQKLPKRKTAMRRPEPVPPVEFNADDVSFEAWLKPLPKPPNRFEFNANVPEAELDTPPIDDSVAFVGQQEVEPMSEVIVPKAELGADGRWRIYDLETDSIVFCDPTITELLDEPNQVSVSRKAPPKKPAKKKTLAKKAKAKPHARKK